MLITGYNPVLANATAQINGKYRKVAFKLQVINFNFNVSNDSINPNKVVSMKFQCRKLTTCQEV